jgi:multiple sugar transport system permease protein/raffinose/stachyose/melibiose transport system permease protein
MQNRIRFSTALLYLAPALVIIGAFFLYPIAYTIPASLFRWDGITSMTWVGLRNFGSLFSRADFRTALANSAIWIGVGTLVHTPLGLVIALLLHRKPPGWAFFRTAYFLPNILSVASLALLWYFFLNPTIGPVDGILRAIGLQRFAVSWLSRTGSALPATMLPFAIYIGFTMLIFLSQLTAIPREYYEAAQMDGASPVRQDLSLTLPLVRRAIVINVLFNASFCLKMIEYPLIMTSGGPGNATTILPLFMYYQMTRAREFGLTMAAGLVAIVFGSAFMGIVFLLQRAADRRWG